MLELYYDYKVCFSDRGIFFLQVFIIVKIWFIYIWLGFYKLVYFIFEDIGVFNIFMF